ncbi:MAG: DUF1801 domain-containing protein [Acidiferrobacterales bacterium]|nr:DUF1801 domain-containing protein [Acidiferrobacterales bacterium]
MTEINDKVSVYPTKAKARFKTIQKLIHEIADKEGHDRAQETLKWGEPAFLVKGGSALRVDWKPKSPNHLFIYFNCNTTLVETFKEVFLDVFEFEGNRAIKLDLDKPLSIEELSQCISVTLRYQKLKHLPLLGF